MSGPYLLASFAIDSLGLLPNSKMFPTMGRGTGPGGSFLPDPVIGLLRFVPKTKAEIHGRRHHSANNKPNMKMKKSMLCFVSLAGRPLVFALPLSDDKTRLYICIYHPPYKNGQ
ncbi:hypothetical protein NE237_028948 [Protea cynaroides]|uniref:Uncharacterized protein n=1 Tax=Protea cynaroides TaxID=273540 RepID=A0A9Q0GQA8_9MAGN|nr:hypothetical protein NE237_028948 [Protea cynaroides]